MPVFFLALILMNPLRHYLEIVRSLFLKGAGFEPLRPQFLALLALGTGLLWLAAWRFQRKAGYWSVIS